MVGNILLAKESKPCTCPSGKICTPCKKKKSLRVIPHVVIEGSNHLPVPIKIETYRERKPTTTTVQFIQRKKPWAVFQKPVLQKRNRWNVLQQPEYLIDPPAKGTKLCQWYRRRRAVKQLKKIAKQELKRQEILKIQKARYERETEFIEQLNQKEKEIRQEEQKLEAELKRRQYVFEQKLKEALEPKPRRQELFEPIIKSEKVFKPKTRIKQVFKAKNRKQEVFKPKKRKQEVIEPKTWKQEVLEPKTWKEEVFDSKPKRQSGFELKARKKKLKKIKATEAKPVAASRYVSAKTLKPHKESFNDRFVNFCYRICCQFYCCVTILMIVGCIIIFVI